MQMKSFDCVIAIEFLRLGWRKHVKLLFFIRPQISVFFLPRAVGSFEISFDLAE